MAAALVGAAFVLVAVGLNHSPLSLAHAPSQPVTATTPAPESCGR